MEQLLLKSLIISLFCVGLRLVSDKGMILYFVRYPFEWAINNNHNVITYLLKPIIGCVTCMSSVWSLVISHYYFGGIDKWTTIIILITACLNTLLYNTIERLQ